MNKNDKIFCKWNETRQKGKLRYILLKEVLPMMGFISFAYILAFKYSIKGPFPIGNFLSVYIINVIIFSVLGYFLGIYSWSSNENKYTEYLISIRVQNVLNDLHKKDLE